MLEIPVMSSQSESQGMQTTPAAASEQHVQSLPDAPTHGEPHAHEHAAAPEGPHFSDKEWKDFQDDDVHAGGAIVCLMGGIFTIGLMLYGTIALIVGA